MNKIAMLGRLTKDPETRYSQSTEPIAVTRYSLAVNRKFKRQGEPDADFFNCVAFGKTGEFAEKYFKKGQQVAISGRLENRSWEDKAGTKRTITEIVVEEQDFAESKRETTDKSAGNTGMQGFYPVDESLTDDDLPF